VSEEKLYVVVLDKANGGMVMVPGAEPETEILPGDNTPDTAPELAVFSVRVAIPDWQSHEPVKAAVGLGRMVTSILMGVPGHDTPPFS
jgi:hypothetical protein